MFLVFDDDPESKDVAVLPVHINYEMLMKQRAGFPMMLGTTTEVKGEFYRLETKLGDCQAVPRGTKSSDDDDEEEDDDDDFDEDEPRPTANALKNLGTLSALICSMKPMMESAFKDRFTDYFMRKTTLEGEILGTYGQDNEYYPIPEMPMSSYALCSGLHLREPQYMFTDSAF